MGLPKGGMSEGLTIPPLPCGIKASNGMNVEKTIADIELLEDIYALPDTRPLQLSDRVAANQRHDEMLAENPWFRLWQRYGR